MYCPNEITTEAEMKAHRKLDLTEGCAMEDRTPSRPDIRVWYDPEDPDCAEGRPITVKVSAAYGAQQRYISLSIEEAYILSGLLSGVAATAIKDPDIRAETKPADFLEVAK
jgi:hypothetical protein